MSKEVVVKSFEACGISVSVDGKEDDKIHCIKDCEIAAAAKPEIEAKTIQLHNPQDDDPFADLEDELDTNELTVDDE